MLHTNTPPNQRRSVTDDEVDQRLDRRANYLLDELKKRDTMTSHAAFCRWNRDFDELDRIDMSKLSPATCKRMERM